MERKIPRLKIKINQSRSVRNQSPSPLLKSSKSFVLDTIYTKIRNRMRSNSPEQPKSPTFPSLAPSFSQSPLQWDKKTQDSENYCDFPDENRDRANSDETYRFAVNPIFLPKANKLTREPSSP